MPLERDQASQLSQSRQLEQMTYVLKLKTNMKKLLWRNVHQGLMKEKIHSYKDPGAILMCIIQIPV